MHTLRVSICRNGADVICAIYVILKQKPYNFTTSIQLELILLLKTLSHTLSGVATPRHTRACAHIKFAGAHVKFAGAHVKFAGAHVKFAGAHVKFAGAHVKFAGAHVKFPGAQVKFPGAHVKFAGAHVKFAGARVKIMWKARVKDRYVIAIFMWT